MNSNADAVPSLEKLVVEFSRSTSMVPAFKVTLLTALSRDSLELEPQAQVKLEQCRATLKH